MKKCFLALLLCVVLASLSSCKKDHTDEGTNKKKIQAAVDKIRKNMSDSLGISFPSLSLLIQTPDEKNFCKFSSFRNMTSSFAICQNSLAETTYVAREVLGYPGKS